MGQPCRPCRRPGRRASLWRALVKEVWRCSALPCFLARDGLVVSKRSRARASHFAPARAVGVVAPRRHVTTPRALPPRLRDASSNHATLNFVSLLPPPQSGGRVLRTLFCAAAALLAIAPAASAQREVSGRVTILGSGEPVADASVGVVGIPVGARTNARGEYRLRAPTAKSRLRR